MRQPHLLYFYYWVSLIYIQWASYILRQPQSCLCSLSIFERGKNESRWINSLLFEISNQPHRCCVSLIHQIFWGCQLYVEDYVASYISEVKENRVIEYESRLEPLRILRQPAITNENEEVSQMFTQPHPCILLRQPNSLTRNLKFLRRYKIFSKKVNDWVIQWGNLWLLPLKFTWA